MELTVSALRNTYKILGGTETDITDVMTIPEALNKVNTKLAAFVASVSVGLLPAAATDGQVLTVSGGKWVSAAIPSQLPAVSAPTDVGKVLKVNDEGKWAAGTDAIEA